MQRIDNILTQTLIILRKINYTMFRLRGNHLILWGGGWQIWSGQIIYFHQLLSRKM